jgi:superfamily II DNA or RNA helicase
MAIKARTSLTSLERLERQLQAITPDRAQGDAWEKALKGWINAGGHPELTKAWMWGEWPGKLKAGLKGDKGVDLVAETRDKQLVAIQVKFRRDPKDPVTAPEVQKLVGSYRKHFALFALASNAWSATRGVSEAVGDEDAMLILREQLLESSYDWAAKKSIKRTKFTPFPFQKVAAENVRKALAKGGRAQIVMACGTGKTVTMLLAAEALDAQRVLVLAPTLLLVKQLRDEWVSKRRPDREWASLAVCSDIGDGMDASEIAPAEFGAPPTTNPDEIAAFLKKPGRRVVFGTYASSDRIAKAQKKAGVPSFDLAVADEAHRIAGVVAVKDKSERSNRVMLEEKEIKAVRRLFATATPRITGSKKTRDGDDILIESMDDESRFGKVAHSVTFQEAVKLKRLVPYKLVVTIVTNDEVADAVQNRRFIDVKGKPYAADEVATAIAIRRAYKELGISKIISYHSRVAGARSFADLITQVPGRGTSPVTEHVAGSMPVNDRKQVLNRLAAATEPYLVTNARCLTEGIDVPALDAVAFADPRKSQVDIVQAVGRAMRKPMGKSKKTTGYIILPVYLTKKELKDPETAVEGTAFEPVLQVLRALKDHDPFMARFMAKILVAKGKKPHQKAGGIGEILEVSIGEGLDKVLAGQLLRAVQLRAVEVSADAFSRAIGELEEFISQHGHAEVPAIHTTGTGYNLGTFISAQRRLYARGELSAERVRILEDHGLTWQVLEAKWARALQVLDQFQRIHGHLAITTDAELNGFRLGQWASDARKRRNPTSRSTLSAERIAQLDAMGFVWSMEDYYWDQSFAKLQEFFAREHHAFVPSRHIESGFDLGSWVGNLRRHPAGLHPARKAMLKAVGFSWRPTTERFERGMSLYLDYVQTSGSHQVPVSLSWKGFPLGKWATYLREKHRGGKLEREVVNRLTYAGFPWDLKYDGPGIYLPLLKQYVQREGNANVAQKHKEDGQPLGTWLGNQREQKSKLPIQLVKELTALGFDWSPAATKWDNGMRALRSFKAREGHCDVPYKHVEQSVNLGQWVAYARSHKARSVPGALSLERIRQLDALGFSWSVRSNQLDAAWATGYELLKQYVARTGSSLVARTETVGTYPLGAWVAKQRAARRSGMLADVRSRKLNTLSGWTWEVKSGPRRFTSESEENWGLGLKAFRRFIKRNRHSEVPTEHIEDGFDLGKWVLQIRKIRMQRSVSKIHEERISILDELGFLWNAQEVQRERAWQRGLSLLREYNKQFGTPRVPARYRISGYQLGGWVAEQRVRYREGKLSSNRIGILQAIAGWTWTPEIGRRKNKS